MDWIDKKAEELIERFYPVFNDSPLPKEAWRKEAIQCAIICVDEIIEALDEISLAESGTTMMDYGQSHFKKVKERLLAKQ